MHEPDDLHRSSRDGPVGFEIVVSPLDSSLALNAVRSVLARGSLAAFELDYQVELFHRCCFLRPAPGVGRAGRPSSAGDLLARIDRANSALFRMFATARTVVVEDEYALSSDPVRSGCAFVDERVLRWRSVIRDPIAAAAYLRAGQHGVPLFAYLSTLDPESIGLRPGENLASESVGRLANSTIAIIVPFGDEDGHVIASRIDPSLD